LDAILDDEEADVRVDITGEEPGDDEEDDDIEEVDQSGQKKASSSSKKNVSEYDVVNNNQ